jgi:hypothetical protein
MALAEDGTGDEVHLTIQAEKQNPSTTLQL